MSNELIPVQNLIYEIRGQKVMLDFDLAKLYQVETKALNQSVRRNMKRFPADFMFRLTPDEFKNMRSQFVTASSRNTERIVDELHRLQIRQINLGPANPWTTTSTVKSSGST